MKKDIKMNHLVLEYLEGYFGGELNESTSDDDIMEAFYELLETADAVAEYINEIRKAPEPKPEDLKQHEAEVEKRRKRDLHQSDEEKKREEGNS